MTKTDANHRNLSIGYAKRLAVEPRRNPPESAASSPLSAVGPFVGCTVPVEVMAQGRPIHSGSMGEDPKRLCLREN
jgi:hypothetical protein